MKPKLATTLVLALALGGCITDPDADLIDAPSPLWSAVTTIVNNSIEKNEHYTVATCKRELYNNIELKEDATARCKQIVREHRLATEDRDRHENPRPPSELEQAFNKRSENQDTADIIRNQQRSNDWIQDGEHKPVMTVDKPDGLD